MRLLDAQYTETPFYGVRRMTAWLRQPGLCRQSQAHPSAAAADGVGGDLSQAPAQPAGRGPHDRPRSPARGDDWPGQSGLECGYHLYPLGLGFVYLVAVIDWFSRYVLSWAVSITMDVAFCVEALEQALRQGQPEIFNTDQGAQLTSLAFTERLQQGGVRISMDGRGRALDQRVCGAVVADV